MAFIRRVIGEILDDLEATEDLALKTPAPSSEGEPPRLNGKPALPPFKVAGVAASGTPDALTLRMLGQILDASKCTLVTIEGSGSPMLLAGRVAEASPAMVILSHLPPEALAQARYQVRRLRARFAELPIVVGRLGRGRHRRGDPGAFRCRRHARGVHAGRCQRPDPGEGRVREGGVAGSGESNSSRRCPQPVRDFRNALPDLTPRASGQADAVFVHAQRPRSRDDHPAADPPVGEPASIARSISAAARSTRATTQNQESSTMTPPSAPSDWL